MSDVRASVFLLNDTATTEIYTLSLHDALPISLPSWWSQKSLRASITSARVAAPGMISTSFRRSEEHTSELQSPVHLVCRLLLEKKNEPTHSYPTAHYLRP